MRRSRAKQKIDYQNLTKEFVIRHLEAEKVAGKQIFPAFAGLNAMNDEGKETDKSRLSDQKIPIMLTCSVCKQLECGGHGSDVLAW